MRLLAGPRGDVSSGSVLQNWPNECGGGAVGVPKNLTPSARTPPPHAALNGSGLISRCSNGATKMPSGLRVSRRARLVLCIDK
jgi:hypothetical protein